MGCVGTSEFLDEPLQHLRDPGVVGVDHEPRGELALLLNRELSNPGSRLVTVDPSRRSR